MLDGPFTRESYGKACHNAVAANYRLQLPKQRTIHTRSRYAWHMRRCAVMIAIVPFITSAVADACPCSVYGSNMRITQKVSLPAGPTAWGRQSRRANASTLIIIVTVKATSSSSTTIKSVDPVVNNGTPLPRRSLHHGELQFQQRSTPCSYHRRDHNSTTVVPL